MYITYKNLDKVRYPAYLLDSDNWEYRDGVLYLDGLVLDDRNMPGDTLGLRRLQTPYKEIYKIKKGVFSPLGILKNKSGQTYIDSIGRLFIYEKTEFAQLKYYKIRKIQKKDTYSLIWLGGLNFPFKVPRPPKPGYTWASVLCVKGYPWKLYEYSEEREKDTRRKI